MIEFQPNPATSTTTSDSMSSVNANSTDSSASVAQYGLPQVTYSTDDLEVHSEGEVFRPQVSTPSETSPFRNLLAFTRKKSILVSIAITILVILFAFTSLLLIAKNSSNSKKTIQATIQPQDIKLKNADLEALPKELQGPNQSLLVNGDLITRGSLKFSNNNFTSILKTENATDNHTYTLPNATGTICLDSNNCKFVTSDQLQALQSQQAASSSSQLGSSSQTGGGSQVSGVTKLNEQSGALTLQGSGGLTITSAGSTLTLNLPQDLTTLGSPNFANLVLSNPLTITSGGTGATTFSTNGVLIGNGTSPVSAVTAVGAGLCLVSQAASAPIFSACSAAASVASVDGLSGVLTILNSSGSGSNITIDSASTVVKGIAQFNSTNFNVIAGTVNTIQDISNSAAPSFAGLSLGTALSLGNGGTGATTALGARTNLGTAASGANADITSATALNTITPTAAFTLGATTQTFTLQGNASSTIVTNGSGFATVVGFSGVPMGAVTYNFDRSATAGTYTICTTVGNCSGSGGGVTTAGGTIGTIPLFSSSQALSNSILTQSGGIITVGGAEVIQGSGGLSIGTASTNSGKIVLYNSSNASTLTLQSGATSGNVTFTLPSADGSSGQCLKTSGGGSFVFGDCLTGSGAGGGVTALNSLTGGLSLNGTANQINVSSGGSIITLSTPQNIDSGATPNFAGLNITSTNGVTIGTGANLGKLVLRDGSTAFTGTLQPATLTANRIITIPDATGTVAVSGSGYISVNSVGNISFTGPLAIADGGTGASSALNARNNLGAAASVSNGDITSTTALNTITPSSSFTIGAIGQSFTLQGNTSSTIASSNGTFSTTLSFTSPTANRSIVLPDAAGTVCLQGSNNCGFASSSGNGNYIQNQNALDQSGDYRISGIGRANTALQAPVIDTATAVALGLGSFNATVINLNQATSLAANKNLTYTAGTGNFDQSASTGLFSTGTGSVSLNGNTSISGVKTLTVNGGLTTLQAGLNVIGGTINLNASSNNASNINTGTSSGAVSIGNSAAGAVNIQSASTIGLTGTTTISGLTAGSANALTVNNSTSTGNILTLQDNGSAVLTVRDGGSFLLGGTTPYSVWSIPGFDYEHTFTATSCIVFGCYGVVFSPTFDNPSSTGLMSGITLNPSYTNATSGDAAPLRVTANISSSTLSSITSTNIATSLTNSTISTSNIGISIATSLTNSTISGNNYGIYISDPSLATSTISGTNYGLYVDGQTAGSFNTGVAIVEASQQTLWLGKGADSTTPNSGIAFGNSRDTNLFRYGANSLHTNGSFSFDGNLTIGDASLDSVSVNASNWTFANDTYFALASGKHLNINTLVTPDTKAQLAISTGASGNKGLVIQGFSVSQGNNLLEVQSSAGSVRFRIDKTGRILGSDDSATSSTDLTTIKTGDTTGGSGLTTGVLTLKSGDGSGTNSSSGNVVLDSGSISGSGTAGTLSLGATNASAVTIGVSGRQIIIPGYANLQGTQGLTLGITAGATGLLQFKGLTAASGIIQLIGQNNPTGTQVITLPNETGTVCTTGSVCAGYAPSSLGSGYINNGTSIQTNANIAIQSIGTNNVTAKIKQNASQTADLLQILDSSSNNLLTVSTSGALMLKGAQTLDLTTESTASANTLTLGPGISTAISGSGAILNLQAGDQSGNTCSPNCSGGKVWILGGNATGSGGTRNGGSVAVDSGIGLSANGSVFIGNTNAILTAIGRVGGSTTIDGGANSRITFNNFSVGTSGQATIAPTTNSIVGLTINGTSGTAATAANILQGGAATGLGITSSNTGTGQSISLTNTSGTQAAGLSIDRNGAGGTTTSLLSLSNTAGTATNAINITGAYTNLINTPTFTLTNGGTLLAASGYDKIGASGAIGFGNAVATTLNIGSNGGTNPAINIDSGTSTIAIGTGAQARTINLGTGAAIQTVALGSTTGSSSTVIQGGTGNAIGDINIGDVAVSGKIIDIGSVDNAATSTVRIATAGGSAQTVSIGSINGGSALTLEAGTGASSIQIGNSTNAHGIMIGTGAAIQTVTLGSTTGSSSTVIQGGTGNILLNSAAGSVIVKNTTDSSGAFQIQNSSNINVLSVDTTADANNLITNPNFEINATGWAALGSSTLTRTTTSGQVYEGVGALKIATTGVVGDGAKFNYNLAGSTAYVFTFMARITTGTFTTFNLGRSDDGSTLSSCTFSAIDITLSNAGWQYISCPFTTGAVSGTRFVYVKQSDATPRNIYIDAVTLTQSSNNNYVYKNASISLNAVLNTPLAVQPTVDTDVALRIATASGGINVLSVDTVNQKVNAISNIGNAFTGITTVTGSYGVVGSSNLITGGGGVQANGADGYGIYGDSLSNTSGIFITSNIAGTNTFPTLVTKANTAQSADLFQAQDSSGAALSIININGYIGVNNATAPNKLSINTLTTPDSLFQAAISTGTNGNKGLLIQGVAGQATTDTLLSAQSSNGTVQFKLDLNGNAYATNSFNLTSTSVATEGKFIKYQTVGSTNVNQYDVVVLVNDSGSSKVVPASVARDNRVYGVAVTTTTTGSNVAVAIGGNYQVTADTGAVAIGDQLVTSLTSGQVTVANKATTGIVGIATTSKSAGSSGLVGISIRTVKGQYDSIFRTNADSATAFQIQKADGTSIFTVDSSTMTLTVKTLDVNGNLTVNGHFISGNTSGSTTAALNANCGTGCTVSISGNDSAGIVTINSGTGAAAGIQATITFANAYGTAPSIVLTPETVPAASTFPQYHYASTTTTFDLKSYNALTDSKTYKFSYHIFQ